MERNEEQQKRCSDLLHRVGALQLKEVYPYVQEQVTAFSSPNKVPVPNIADELDYTRLVLTDVLKDIPVRDPDETESSSEEESCDELNLGTKRVENYLPMSESPGLKWAQDRAEIIRAWSWLQDASAKCAFQRKHYEDLYNHLRANKVPVAVDDKFSSPAATASPNTQAKIDRLIDAKIQVYKAGPHLEQQNAIMSNNPMSSKMMKNSVSSPRTIKMDNLQANVKQPSSTSGASTSCASSIVKSPSDPGKPNKHIGGGLEPLALEMRYDSDVSTIARRCLPTKLLRPRKIYRVQSMATTDLEDQSQCECNGTQICSTCYTKGDPYGTCSLRTIPRNWKERVAALDSSFHKNLSFAEDIPMSLLLDSSIKMEGWKTNAPKSTTFLKITPQYVGGYRRMVKRGTKTPNNVVDQKRKGRPRLMKKLDENVAGEGKQNMVALPPRQVKAVLATKGKRRASSGSFITPKRTIIKRRKYNSVSVTLKKKRQSMENNATEKSKAPTKPVTRQQGPGRPRLTQPTPLTRRRRGETDDINNIVIPHSMAAATRIEKIVYKEIPTPGWRPTSWYWDLFEVKDNAGMPQNPVDVEDLEDMTDETFVALHGKCAAEEQRRFMTAMKPKSRRQRRADSKSETVDPLSAPESPAMPASPQVVSQNAQIVTAIAATMAATAVKAAPGRRRRTSSLKKDMELEEATELKDYGYEDRKFPLLDPVYKGLCAQMPYGFFDSMKKDETKKMPPPKSCPSKVISKGKGGGAQQRKKMRSLSVPLSSLKPKDKEV